MVLKMMYMKSLDCMYIIGKACVYLKYRPVAILMINEIPSLFVAFICTLRNTNEQVK